jgi:hypothetical protein
VTRATHWIDSRRPLALLRVAHFYDAHAPCSPPARHVGAHALPYDAAVAFVDEQVGVFIRSLEQRGLLDRTVIDPSPATTARAWATTARRPTACSCTSPCSTCRSSSVPPVPA